MHVGLPGGHAERVRHELRAWPQLVEQTRPDLKIDAAQQVHGDRVCVLDLRLEKILPTESDAIGNAGLRGVLVRFENPLRVDIDAERTSAEVLGGRNRDPSVAGAKVNHEIILPDLRKLEHPLHDGRRSWNVGDVEPGLFVLRIGSAGNNHREDKRR